MSEYVGEAKRVFTEYVPLHHIIILSSTTKRLSILWKCHSCFHTLD